MEKENPVAPALLLHFPVNARPRFAIVGTMPDDSEGASEVAVLPDAFELKLSEAQTNERIRELERRDRAATRKESEEVLRHRIRKISIILAAISQCTGFLLVVGCLLKCAAPEILDLVGKESAYRLLGVGTALLGGHTALHGIARQYLRGRESDDR